MHVLLRGTGLQRARLTSGLILFAFAATHFFNHALGLISVDIMQDAQDLRQIVTRSLVGSVVLGLALITHIGLALCKLATRTTLRMPPWEAVQVFLGLLIPFWLFPHIVNTRVAHTLFGVNDTYLYELARLWPGSALTQSLLLLMVWLHGCIGLHFWLRIYPSYRAITPFLLAVAIVLPVAALAGFMVAGRGVALLLDDPALYDNIRTMTNWPDEAAAKALGDYRNLVRIEFGIALAVVVGFIGIGMMLRRTGPRVKVTYTGGPTVSVPAGATLLEISRQCGVPHAAVCGGRARCSTCRVHIDEGINNIPAAQFAEVVTLASIGAPPDVRLACQMRPHGNVAVTRLLRADSAGPHSVDLDEMFSEGVEKALAVMFVDLRGFTQLSETKLPFDVVYILNEFFRVVGTAITQNGGRIDKFIGDGLLAVFGERTGVNAGCRQALRTARAIDLALDHVNAKLITETGQPLQVGIGIDAGPLVLGRIGYGDNVDFTVIGNAVNVASRLEALTKEHGKQIMLSRRVATEANWVPTTEFTTTTNVRGVAEPVDVIGIVRGRDLPSSLLTMSDSEVVMVTRGGRGRG